MKTKIVPGIVLLFCSLFQLAHAEVAERTSLNAAKQWLHSVDNGDYAQSWESGALTFKLTISQQHWEKLMNAIRAPLGPVVSRQLLEQRPAVDPKGLPKGEYMVVFFKTKFQKKKEAHELVTLVKETDGKWKVLTYQVQ